MKKKIDFKVNTRMCINLIMWAVLTFAITLVSEGLQRNSIDAAVNFFNDKTRVFLLNYSIFLSITSISFLFTKKRFVYSIISSILLIGHAISGMLMNFRGTPLIWADLYSIQSGIAIAEKYISSSIIITSIITIVAIVFISLILWKTEKVESQKKIHLSALILIAIIVVFTTGLKGYIEECQLVKVSPWDLPDTYRESGFMYSFIYTRDGFKVSKPNDYKQDEINSILVELEGTKAVASSDMRFIEEQESINPNIIFVQLESFFDPYRLVGIEFEEDPIPFIRELYNSTASGYIDVPAYGGGTVRTEFEILTGLNTDYLPVGEIPNNNVLKKQPVETLAYILKSKGYDTSAIHNYFGDFYNRNTVYSNLGFDLFITKESMPEPTSGQWKFYPEDTLNLPYMERLISESEDPQFIYNVTVELHGSFYHNYDEKTMSLVGNLNEGEEGQLQHYLRNIQEVDSYVKELVEYIENLDESTVLVLYSDHLPSLDILNRSPEELAEDDHIYRTEYMITDNMGIINRDKKVNMEAYQLGSYVLEMIDMVDGLIPNFHQTFKDSTDYDNKFEVIQYDLLYGKKYSYNKENPYKATNMEIGIDKMNITDYYFKGDNLVVKGENFNYVSTVNINNKDCKTVFKDEKTLIVPEVDKNIKTIKVLQKGIHNTVLGESNTIKVE